MSVIITDACISCGACITGCPRSAIYEPGMGWAIADGTCVTGVHELDNGNQVGALQRFAPMSNRVYYVVKDKCTECIEVAASPLCAAVCPVDCCILNHEWAEPKEKLLNKYKRLHACS